jgi:glycogen operon protein
MDSLRYWVREMHVDGFRFDLATVLGRGTHGFDRDGAFFACIAQDPLLAGVKLIAEPWDIGAGGYQLGQFPTGWAEWNDRFRDTMRAFWLRGGGTLGEFAQRLCASSDLFRQRRRAPSASVHYIVAHDGFTLRDLVSYDHRHNRANGEDNRDGHAHELSWNCGHEGPTDDTTVSATRTRLQRALLATLLLAQGTPMLAAGAELGHTQRGNNNAYCQDNPISWIDWTGADPSLTEFTVRLLQLRRQWRPLGARWYDDGAHGSGESELRWLRADGEAMTAHDWQAAHERSLGLLVAAAAGLPRRLLLINGGADDARFRLPPGRWSRLLDSASDAVDAATLAHDLTVAARSLSLLGEIED